MAAGLQAYLDELRAALRPALCLHNFPSEIVERHSKPVIEVAEPGSLLVLPPVTVARSLQVGNWAAALSSCESCLCPGILWPVSGSGPGQRCRLQLAAVPPDLGPAGRCRPMNPPCAMLLCRNTLS